MSSERKLIGSVGVDSGQLMLMDPCYVEGQWKVTGDVVGVKAWGGAQEEVASYMREEGHSLVANHTGTIYIQTNDRVEAENLCKKIEDYAKSPSVNKVIVTTIVTDRTYDKVSELTLSKEQAGELNYAMGHAGLGVAFSTGLGDGTYDVYATYTDLGQLGTRITKVEVELISEEEIKEINAEFNSDVKDSSETDEN